MSAIYISYDGALDPLGASQVIPYLVGLADRGLSITLVSFEKAERWGQRDVRDAARRLLASRGIRWRPLPYHRRPRLTATLLDVMVGSRVVASELGRSASALVHCRSDVAMVIGRIADFPHCSRMLYDVRGFFSEERVQAQSWRRGSFVDRLVRRIEAGNLGRADGAVVLTQRAATEVLRRRPSLPLHRVIPTCADTSLFTPRTPGQEPRYGLVYSGSLGTWYMAKEMAAFAQAAADFVPGKTLFLTPQIDDCARLGLTGNWSEIRTGNVSEVASCLRSARALFFFGRPIASRFPTKFAEGLASGLPVVCSRGIGDLDEIVEKEAVGVLVKDFSRAAYRDAGRRLQLLLQDPQLAARCRQLAESRYSLRLGVDAYQRLYSDMLAGRESVLAGVAKSESPR